MSGGDGGGGDGEGRRERKNERTFDCKEGEEKSDK